MVRIADLAAGRPIALYGAGRHTAFLLSSIRGYSGMPIIRFIIDDASDQIDSVQSVPVYAPHLAPADDVAYVVASSDTIEDRLAQRAHDWVRSRFTTSGSPPTVIRLYQSDSSHVVLSHSDQFQGVWGLPGSTTNDHLPLQPKRRILRLPTAAHRPVSRTRPDEFPLPPPALRAGYCADDDANYLASGLADTAAIRALIQRTVPGFTPRRVLDWGCSSGRLIRHWTDLATTGGEVWGTDLCATALNWATENLSPPFRFFQGTTRPRLPLPDASIDLVYANSVFTHIRELWDAWLMELRRVIRPGGLLFVTILDEQSWAWIGRNPGNGIALRCPGIDFTTPLTDDFVAHGSDSDTVSFWHTDAVKRRWAFAFDPLAFEHGTVPYQTGVLLRRPL